MLICEYTVIVTINLVLPLTLLMRRMMNEGDSEEGKEGIVRSE